MLQYGRFVNDLLNKYFQTNNKKHLLSELNKWILSEKTKYLKKNPVKLKPKEKIQKKKVEEKLKVVEKEVLVEVKKVREKKKIEAKKIAKQKADYIFKVNDKVRITDSNSCGVIEKIEKKHAFINYGNFTTKTTLDKLELVESTKQKT